MRVSKFTTCVVKAAQECEADLPWVRGMRRADMIARRETKRSDMDMS